MIIAIIGKRRSGKDTVAKYIEEEYGFKHLKISSKLKQLCKLLFEFSDDQLESDSKEIIDERWGISPRTAMQFIGTDMFQYKIQELMPGINRKFWIHSFVNYLDHYENVVISDLRFLHEFDILKNYDLKIIYVQNDNRKHVINHISDTEFFDIPYNYKVVNNDTITSLYYQIDQIMYDILQNT